MTRPRQIVDRLNVYKRRRLQQMKDDFQAATPKPTEEGEAPQPVAGLNIAEKEKEIESLIENIFCPAGDKVRLSPEGALNSYSLPRVV